MAANDTLSALLFSLNFVRFGLFTAFMIAADLLNQLIFRVSVHNDSQAYKELFLLYYKRLLQFATSITHTKQSAEDVVSDVFLKIWTNREGLRSIENLHLYLYVSTKNHSINYLMREKKQASFSIDDSQVELKSIYFNPEQLMITAEMFKRIRNAVQLLPPKCQLIFKLVKEDGLKYKEVAELLHLSLKTIESQMTIALRRIGKSIQFNLESSLS